MNNDNLKLIVIGIDGGSWNIINKFLDHLPNFKKIIQKGISCDLISTVPPVTCPAWKSYSTGKTQDELKTYWWGHINFEKGSINFFSSLDFKHDEIWDTLNKFGYKSLVINLPLTYPPKKINGMMIAGFPASDADAYTYPSSLKNELRKEFNYRIHPNHHIELFKEKTLNEIYTLIQTRFNVLYHYLNENEFNFAHVTIFYTDDIQHFLWDDDEAILNAYKIIDKNIGKILSEYINTNLIIMSDHGFEKISDAFFINNYLASKGFLIPKVSQSNLISSLSNRMLNNKMVLRIINYIFMSLPREKQIKLKKMFLPGEDEFSIEKTIDLERSAIVGTKQGPIFINWRILDKDKYPHETFLNQFKDELKQIRTPDNQPLIKEIFEVSSDGDVPSFIVIPNEGFEIEIRVTPDNILWKSETDDWKGWKAHHRPEGIFLAYGKGISNLSFDENIGINEIADKIFDVFELPKEYFEKGTNIIPTKKNLQKVISGLKIK
jgi:predicted AlkP superfamily phosphohydrolase/phosphomutase